MRVFFVTRIVLIACGALLFCCNQLSVAQSAPNCPNTFVPTTNSLNVEYPIPAAQGTKWGYVDAAGRLVIPAQFDCAGGFSEHLAPVKIGKKWGYIDTAGHLAIPARYFWAAEFSDGLALVATSKPWQPLGTGEYGITLFARITYVDQAGHTIRPPLSVQDASNFSDGLAAVRPGYIAGGCGKVGYLNKRGEWAIKPQFDDAQDFSANLAAVNNGAKCRMGGEWGYTNEEGQLVIPFKYQSALPFRSGHACVLHGTQWNVIDVHGNENPVSKTECLAAH